MKRLFLAISFVCFSTGCAQHTPSVTSTPLEEVPVLTITKKASDYETISPDAVPAGSDTDNNIENSYATVTKPPRDRISYSECNVDGPFIALTFDDGPVPATTPRLLDILKKRNVRATFFVTGQNAERYPDIVRRAFNDGHEIANHSWNHPRFTAAKTDVSGQLRRTSNIIQKITGTAPTTMRPPYGATNAALNARIKREHGLTPVMWSLDPQDWKYRNANYVATQVIERVRPGAIILLHDIHPSTIDAVPRILDSLLARGFQFVTVSELIAMDRPDTPKNPEPTEPAPPEEIAPECQ